MDSLEELATRFEADRRHLKSVAFNLLGSLAEAEDVVQSAWLKASSADYRSVDNLTGWFTTITAREAVDQLRARRRRAERPLDGSGELDRLVAAADDEVVLADSVSRALLVVLDRLSPAQRVAFVLHDVFGVPFEAIGEALGRSASAAKKLASRARVQLHPAPATRSPRSSAHTRLVEAFLAASRGGDIQTLLNLLAPDVVRTVDPALVPAGVALEIRGAKAVATETRRFAHRARAGVVVLVDGVPGIVIAPANRLEALLQLRFDADDRIEAIDITADGERLRRASLMLPQ
ncbi:sigma-70 family RNA polymerase sigma factor [Mycobacterium vicinigordonae]|uniref:Sigma-70 family RNA polymerase sigma factor n=1 Tax=Mycobacterium vicinigordonae TaxID=1719132 RepID=A0A7D6HLN6_9MYCO|nr:sigma-70 family RNA polymerase sigma factor [Mycobacterium vicinigordonae]QLL05411.1 sigma-70 family RNA polymerase sigma factor [Mycobacterium vicinigordonae]